MSERGEAAGSRVWLSWGVMALLLLVGGENLTPTAEKMRRLMHYGQIFQSHSLHFFHLASPDLLFGFDADPMKRNVVGIIEKPLTLAKLGSAFAHA